MNLKCSQADTLSILKVNIYTTSIKVNNQWSDTPKKMEQLRYNINVARVQGSQHSDDETRVVFQVCEKSNASGNWEFQ